MPPPQSFALLKQLIEVGCVANTWAELYPSQKWRGDDSASRRFLTQGERYRLRRACYRLWLYSLAFHTPNFSRTARRSPSVMRTRAALIRSWPTFELAELLDIQLVFRQILDSTITPSNGTVLRRHKNRHPDDPFPLVSRELHGTTLEGWGDEITHYYVLEDMLKLNPSQLLYLYHSIMEATQGGFNAGSSAKGLVEAFVAGLDQAGLWFENNGETLGETISFVIRERGGEAQEIRSAVEERSLGVVQEDEI
ncbi:uncharacterized protein KY384_000195 [Bacidia gigantensis]|uniref:uncharacterized protein n=1 Tax=Bacidia gigantensis TaxID=2732470 RepID=UPI001D0486BB|nr:uncharacterized protein KY384_000195 [Bacidia gigantensis]KAG8526202.1 hypothetical protein KY384_000195 [Bacidia gigantensis]